MTPKQKAEELIQKYTAYAAGDDGEQLYINANWCALIAVDEIITNCVWSIDQYKRLFNTDPLNLAHEATEEYWQQVKQEIENL